MIAAAGAWVLALAVADPRADASAVIESARTDKHRAEYRVELPESVEVPERYELLNLADLGGSPSAGHVTRVKRTPMGVSAQRLRRTGFVRAEIPSERIDHLVAVAMFILQTQQHRDDGVMCFSGDSWGSHSTTRAVKLTAGDEVVLEDDYFQAQRVELDDCDAPERLAREWFWRSVEKLVDEFEIPAGEEDLVARLAAMPMDPGEENWRERHAIKTEQLLLAINIRREPTRNAAEVLRRRGQYRFALQVSLLSAQPAELASVVPPLLCQSHDEVRSTTLGAIEDLGEHGREGLRSALTSPCREPLHLLRQLFRLPPSAADVPALMRYAVQTTDVSLLAFVAELLVRAGSPQRGATLADPIASDRSLSAHVRGRAINALRAARANDPAELRRLGDQLADELWARPLEGGESATRMLLRQLAELAHKEHRRAIVRACAHRDSEVRAWALQALARVDRAEAERQLGLALADLAAKGLPVRESFHTATIFKLALMLDARQLAPRFRRLQTRRDPKAKDSANEEVRALARYLEAGSEKRRVAALLQHTEVSRGHSVSELQDLLLARHRTLTAKDLLDAANRR